MMVRYQVKSDECEIGTKEKEGDNWNLFLSRRK